MLRKETNFCCFCLDGDKNYTFYLQSILFNNGKVKCFKYMYSCKNGRYPNFVYT